MTFFEWLVKKTGEIEAFNHFISIIASFFSVLGIIIAIILLIITIKQISTAAKNLKASTIYSIAKDGRELRTEIARMVRNSDFNYGYVFNYIHSVWHQRRLGTLDNRMWTPIENEVCIFLRDNPEADSYWNADTKKLFDGEFVKYVEKASQNQECKDRKGGLP